MSTVERMNEILELQSSLQLSVRSICDRVKYIAKQECDVTNPPVILTDTSHSLATVEQNHIQAVLRWVSGNKSRAANILGIERSTLDRKLKKYCQNAD